MIKKIILNILLCFFISLNAFAAELYLPIENIMVPDAQTKWNLFSDIEAAKVTYTLKEKYIPSGSFTPHMEFLSRKLKSYEKKNDRWQNSLNKSLKSNQKKLSSVYRDDLNAFEIVYETKHHLMPVKGFLYAKTYQDHLYTFYCESEKNPHIDIQKTCLETFQKIKWPDQITIKADKSHLTFTKYIQKLKHSQDVLAQEKNELLEKFKPQIIDYKKYTYLLMLESLVHNKPSPNNLEKIKRLQNLFEAFPTPKENLSEVLEWHTLYLKDKFREKQAQELLSKETDVPYWLLGFWLGPQKENTALNLLKRDTNTFAIKDYVIGQIHYQNKNYSQALPFLLKANKPTNLYLSSQIAYSYFYQKNSKNSLSWMKKTLKLDPNDAKALFIQAHDFDSQKNDEEASKIFKKLASQKNLPREIRFDTYNILATRVVHPDERITIYKKILKEDPKSLTALYNLGKLYLVEKNNKKNTIYYFEKYLNYAPQNSEKIKELRVIIADLKKPEKPKNDNFFPREP